jgi:rare lipoprotein A
MKVWLAAAIGLGLSLAQTYTVRPGDTLSTIARNHQMTISQLKQSNGLRSDKIRIGQVLLLKRPGPNSRWRLYQIGWAAWYGPGFHGRRTASGERYNQYGISAAHLKLRLGTWVRITNRRNGRSIVLRINDRGPYSRRYILDLSGGAKSALGIGDTAPVKIEVLR